MKLQYRIIPLTADRVVLQAIVDTEHTGTQEFPSAAAAAGYVKQTFAVRGLEAAWTPEVWDVVSTQVVEVPS